VPILSCLKFKLYQWFGDGDGAKPHAACPSAVVPVLQIAARGAGAKVLAQYSVLPPVHGLGKPMEFFVAGQISCSTSSVSFNRHLMSGAVEMHGPGE